MKTSRLIFLLAVLLPLILFISPMWRITLEAPQYPSGISMYIWISKITGETESTLQNVNILNHYIGMRFIEPDSIPELDYFPIIILAMVGFGLIAWFVNNKKVFLTWTIVLAILGFLGIFDFYLWLYEYGHNLDPKAPIKIEGMTYQPPLIGTKWLLNFKADSWPHYGGIALGISIMLGFVSYFLARKEGHQNSIKATVPRFSKSASLAVWFFAVMAFLSCSNDKIPIAYGEDQCAHCKMKIVQPQYGAEIMSKKGKAFKFDAIECLIDFEKKNGIAETEIANEFVVSYTAPETLQSADNCFYLRSPMLPSPMGMFITAFSSREEAEKFQSDHSGDIFSWNDLKSNFGQLPSMHHH